MSELKKQIYNRGVAPNWFIDALAKYLAGVWTEKDSKVYATNSNVDIFTNLSAELGPYTDDWYRLGVIGVALWVLAGFESGWNPNEGKDTSNSAEKDIWTWSCGLYQTSPNAMNLDPSIAGVLEKYTGGKYTGAISQAQKFSELSRFTGLNTANFNFSSETTALVLRKTVHHHGPVLRKDINKWTSPAAVHELLGLVQKYLEAPKDVLPPVTEEGGVPAEVRLAYSAMKANGTFGKVRYLAEIDYSINSSKHRLFIYDLQDKKMETHKVAHGSGGKNHSPHDGYCREVSNTPDSHMSCLGLFKCSEIYDGPHGKAIRIDGLSPTNSHARDRGVVLHRSDYVIDDNNEISGRSLGCPAFARSSADEIIAKLHDGSPLLSHYKGEFHI